MTLNKPSANTLIDQTFLGQMVDEINTIGSSFSKASSSIYDTSVKKSKTTYFGGFTLATVQLEVTHTLSASKATTKEEKFSFGKSFLTDPLVFATIETDSTTGTGSTPSDLLCSVVISNVNKSGASASITVASKAKSPTVKYRVNILAIGLSTL